MEDGDLDAKMADYGTDFSDDVDPSVTRESGVGSSVFPFFGGISRFAIPDWPARIGNRKTGRFRFGRDRESGSRGRRHPGISWSGGRAI